MRSEVNAVPCTPQQAPASCERDMRSEVNAVPCAPEPGALVPRIRRLLAEQRREWPEYASNFDALDRVRTRTLAFDGFVMRLQFNPGRLRSTSAQVDEVSLRKRPCFLCDENRPVQQRGLGFADEYRILCNPFPIFRDHLTIVHRVHQPQRLALAVGPMLDLVAAMGEAFVVLYNGPACGASAPDHLHFQAGESDFLPLVTEYEAARAARGTCLFEDANLRCFRFDGYLRTMVSLESPSIPRLQDAFETVRRALTEVAPAPHEPMVNVVARWREGVFHLLILPRARHRPSFYLASGDDRLLLSPATVDLAGVCVTPLERDFERVTHDHLTRMCDEVCLGGPRFDRACALVARSLLAADTSTAG